MTEATFAAELARLRDQNAALAAERDALRVRAEKAEHERNEFRKLYLLVTYELERLKRQLFGQKAETVDPAQVQLVFGPVLAALEKARGGGLAEAQAVETELSKLRERAAAEVSRRKAEKKPPAPHGRRDLSKEDLPVEEIVIEPPERRLPGGEALVRIGEEVAEHIDRRPASLVRVRVVRPKYKAPEEAAAAVAAALAAATGLTARVLAGREPLRPGSIIIGDLPDRPIERGIAGPGLLAHVLVSKYADHKGEPYFWYRVSLEDRCDDGPISVARVTLDLVEPLARDVDAVVEASWLAEEFWPSSGSSLRKVQGGRKWDGATLPDVEDLADAVARMMSEARRALGRSQ